MIHSGSVIAAGISQGRSTSLKRDFKVSPYTHTRGLRIHSCVSAESSSRPLGLPQHPIPVTVSKSKGSLA